MVVLWPLCTLLRTPLLAQSLPDAPKPKPAIKHFNSRVFVGGVSLLAASKTADAITTQQLLDRGGWEGNPLLGRHSNPAKQSKPIRKKKKAQKCAVVLEPFPSHKDKVADMPRRLTTVCRMTSSLG